MYKPEDFNIKNAPKEMVQFVLENVKDFESRYDHALGVMDRERCPLYHADCSLNDDIYEAMCEWCNDNYDSYPEDFDYDIEEIFG